MDPANALLNPATTAQEEQSLVAFQNLTLASPTICPTQSSDSGMVGPAFKEPTSVQEFYAARTSLWPKLLEASSKLDKLETDMKMKQNLECIPRLSLLPPSDSTMLACLVDKFLHMFTPLESGQRKAWVQSKINELSQASRISVANIVEFMIVHVSRVERGLYSFPSNSVARAITCVTDDYERSIFKALFLLELNHTTEDELEDGYTFVTDVVGCIRTSRRERIDTLRLCS